MIGDCISLYVYATVYNNEQYVRKLKFATS